MPNKNELISALQQCDALVREEIELLDAWEIDPGITSGRAAECRIARRFLSSGLSSSSAIMSRILQEANNANPESIVSSPSDHSLGILKEIEGSLRSRQALSPASFPNDSGGQLHFELMIDMSKDNAQHAVDFAAALFQECING